MLWKRWPLNPGRFSASLNRLEGSLGSIFVSTFWKLTDQKATYNVRLWDSLVVGVVFERVDRPCWNAKDY